MAFEFRLPDLGEGIHEAEIRRWLAAEGETVREDQPLVEVETDKAVVEISSPVAGVVARHGAREGDIITVGSVLAVIETARVRLQEPARGAQVAEEPLGIVGFAAPQQVTPRTAQGAALRETVRTESRVLATPIARRVARDLGVDLSSVAGTGPGGRITETDVHAYASTVARGDRAELAEERIPLRGLRRRIAERMAASAFAAPHVTAMDEVDVTAIVDLKTQLQAAAEARGLHLTYLPFIVKAVVIALQANPHLNASVDAQAGVIILKRYYHIGVATATEEGLLVPVIRDADRKDLWAIAAELAWLTEAARTRTIAHQDLVGSTFTISNYGVFGGLFATPIINPPEAAILGVGRIQDRPVVRNGQVVSRKMMGVSLSFDHRAVDGAGAGRFLQHVIEALEHPERLAAPVAGGT